jgi:DNA-binding IclR family transcriptional regulator
MARADRIDAAARLDHFAELLSQDIPVPQIAERLGIGKGAAYALKMKLERMYGGPAV